ncbi:MAG: hypothetical protein M3Q98_16215 [Actinomycetota bacterium]|nr:hypothetical protein [Actinomycetota bacterium]
MPLIPQSDVSPADWFVDADADWWTKVILGPPGFEAYARVLYDLDEEAPIESGERMRADLHAVLVRHTATPEDCYFALWDGWGDMEGGRRDIGLRYAVTYGSSRLVRWGARLKTARAKRRNYAPAFAQSFLDGQKVSVPNRDFYLFSGSVGDPVDWGAADYARGLPRDHSTPPALMWPADRSWFVAGDVDPDWIGVGGSQALIDEILAAERLDVVPTTYGPDQPEYR